MLIKDTNMPKMYEDGYETGYEWLNRAINFPNGANFKHPSVPGGYIPGGPFLMSDKDKYTERLDYERETRQHTNLMREWHRGFIEGINQYVEENQLEYPQLSTERF